MNEQRPAGGHTSEFSRILEENERYVEQFDRSKLTAAPLSGLAVLACMDARIDVEDALGLRVGDAHIIRNAGGLATDDAIRSLVVSQELLGTEEVIVIQHTGCGLLGVDDAALSTRLSRRSGRPGSMRFGGFGDLEGNLRQTVQRIREHPWLRRGPVHGMIYEVESGRLREVI
jgi:carbonic anhydrase